MNLTLQRIRRSLEQSFSGALIYSAHRVLVSNGHLMHVLTDDDAMWLLRRLMCSGWISEQFASELQARQLPVDIRCFPTLTPQIWHQSLVDRARQNLFDLSYLSEEPEEIADASNVDSPLLDLDSYNLLDEIEGHSKRLAPLRKKVHQVFVQRLDEGFEHPIIAACPTVFQLSSLLAQAPMEELDLLLEIEVLEEQGLIQTALTEDGFEALDPSPPQESESVDNFSSPSLVDDVLDTALAFDEPPVFTEEEKAMFGETKPDLDVGHYSVSKENLDRVSLPSPEEQSQVYAMMTQANQLLRVMSRWVEASGKPATDWLNDLLAGESSTHSDFVESSSISNSGELILKSAVEVDLAASALGSLLNRAARSPLAGDGRRTFLRAIDRWEQQWRS